MLRGEPIELFDGGKAERDYTFVDDVVEALVRLARSQEPSVTVNVGSHHPVRTTDMVDALERSLGLTATRILRPAQPGDVPATYADISRAKAILGWEPRWSFQDGIDAFCGWVRVVEGYEE
jgi:UDP-glucuronate 4-epimerase